MDSEEDNKLIEELKELRDVKLPAAKAAYAKREREATRKRVREICEWMEDYAKTGRDVLSTDDKTPAEMRAFAMLARAFQVDSNEYGNNRIKF